MSGDAQARQAVAAGSSDPGGSVRIPAASLLAHLSRAGLQAAQPDHAVLVVNLNRSDRLQALAQDPSNPAVLAEVARRVQSILRPTDRYAFVSNEELWILLTHRRDAGAADQTARQLHDALRPAVQVGVDSGSLTIRIRPVIGGAWASGRIPADALRMIEAAGSACRKAGSRDDKVFVTRVVSPSTDPERSTLGAELRHALREGRLDVHFQPQIDLRAGNCIGAEALIRWKRANGTSVAAPVIASLCEELDLTGALTRFVVHHALRHQGAWRRQGLDLSVSVNLFASTLTDPEFPDGIEEALRTWQTPAGRLTLELTEAAIAGDESQALAFMRTLRGIGCAIAIDDFGTGYSSFAWLQRYPIDEIKIDRSFVRSLDSKQNGADKRTPQALIALAHAFGMRALAEAVETPLEASELIAAGCDRAQGHHFSAAIPGQTLVDWCRRHRESALLGRSEDSGLQ